MIRIIIAIFLSLTLIACTEEGNPIDPITVDPNEPPVEEQGTQEDLQRAMLHFGFKTFLQIHGDNPSEENLLISPLSLETALYMAANGAENENTFRD